MKYKLLKDTPTHKAGIILHQFSNSDKYFPATACVNGYLKDTVENNSDWFEPVDEFKKEFFISKHLSGKWNASIIETFATEEQAKAKKELMEHIVKFEEPKE